MSDSSIVIIQGTVGLYTVATRCHTCFAVTLKYTEDSSLTILRHSLLALCDNFVYKKVTVCVFNHKDKLNSSFEGQ